MEVTDPSAGPTEALKKEGILCKSSWEVYCSLVVRLQDMSVKGWPLCRDLVPLQWRLSQGWCPFSLSSFLPEFLAPRMLAWQVAWQPSALGPSWIMGPLDDSGWKGPQEALIQPLVLTSNQLSAGYGLLGISLCYPVLAFDTLWFLGWPSPNLFDHQTSELPAFQATENAEAVLWI